MSRRLLIGAALLAPAIALVGCTEGGGNESFFSEAVHASSDIVHAKATRLANMVIAATLNDELQLHTIPYCLRNINSADTLALVRDEGKTEFQVDIAGRGICRAISIGERAFAVRSLSDIKWGTLQSGKINGTQFNELQTVTSISLGNTFWRETHIIAGQSYPPAPESDLHELIK